MRFEKWQALGNDYLIVERDELPFALTPARVRKLCEGHFGVFADGVLELSRPADASNVADLRIFNPDGSEAELSGNGAREAILYLRRRSWTAEDEFSIQTVAGTIRPQITGPDTCRVDMGKATLVSKDFPGGPEDGRGTVNSGGKTWSFRHVSIGNPQCAIQVDSERELAELDLSAIGHSIEADAQFPNRTNVSWYTAIEASDVTSDEASNVKVDEASSATPHETSNATPEEAADVAPEGVRIRARIFERGVGETLSSGTGATGAAVAYLQEREPARRPGAVTVVLDGGELEVEVGEELSVNLTGWAVPVFEGRLSDNFVKELNETE